MNSKKEVEIIVSALVMQLENLLADKLNSVILYGSYARGDYEEYSDIDVMILLDVPQEQVKIYRKVIYAKVSDFEWEHDLLISPVIQSIEVFLKYKNVSGFYKNILTEGVQISA
ncbi:MAG: nucleotidyltransferase domain-containing protein [Oscillospiraceae bacterium]|nr:nucleotidyltransferase domain-containing protein [Oscillospiraceae bacterium]